MVEKGSSFDQGRQKRFDSFDSFVSSLPRSDLTAETSGTRTTCITRYLEKRYLFPSGRDNSPGVTASLHDRFVGASGAPTTERAVSLIHCECQYCFATFLTPF